MEFSEEPLVVGLPLADMGVEGHVVALGLLDPLVLEVEVEHPSVVFPIHLRRVKASAGDPTNIHADANAGVPVLDDLLHHGGVAIKALDAVVVDRNPDVVLLGQFFQVVPNTKITGFDDDQANAHELGELEEATVLFFVRRSAGHSKGVGAEAGRIESRLLLGPLLLRGVGVDVVSNNLKILDAMLHSEVDGLLEVQVAEGPGLDGQLVSQIAGLGGQHGCSQCDG